MSGKPAWFPGEQFLAASSHLHKSGLVKLITDRDSALVVADQIEEQGLLLEANAIRDFLIVDGPWRMLCLPKVVSRPTNLPVE